MTMSILQDDNNNEMNENIQHTIKTFNYISSLRFHNGLTHFWGPPDNEEKLNHGAIRKQFFLTILFNE